jgi:hypothetical protein
MSSAGFFLFFNLIKTGGGEESARSRRGVGDVANQIYTANNIRDIIVIYRRIYEHIRIR